MTKSNTLLAALALGAAAGTAQAGVVSVSQTVSLGQLLDGTSRSFTLDLNAALAQQGVGSADVQSGNLIVYGYSSPEEQYQGRAYDGYQHTGSNTRTVQYSYTYYVKCGTFGWSTCSRTGYNYSNVTDQSYTEIMRDVYGDYTRDEMAISAGNTTARDTTDQSSYSHSTGQTYFNYQYGGYYSGYTSIYGRLDTEHSAQYGALAVSLALDTAALFDIRNDGLFSFIANAPGLSQFRLDSVSIDLLALLPVLPDAAANAVPEPGTFGLFGGALGVLAALRLRRRKRA